MSRLIATSLVMLFLAACVQMPPSPADIEAKRFQPVANKSVIYVARPLMDSDEAGALMLDGQITLTTFRGTYHRWEVDPGPHQIDGVGPSSIRINIDTEPGRIYYFLHTVLGTTRTGPIGTSLQQVSEAEGQALVRQGQLYP